MKPSNFIPNAIALLCCAFCGPALAQTATDWKAVDRSMSGLLNDGWRIENMSAAQVFKREHIAWRGLSGGNDALASVPDGNEYNFLLSKSGKWTICVVISPAVDGAFSRCRALN